eukprot:1156152-Pelagomonas_calceolata.AAC.10
MIFGHKTTQPHWIAWQATAEYMSAPFLAGCRRIRHFASEHHLTDRPHTMLWLTKAYALPASMYACQIWGTIYMKEGAEMDSLLPTVNLCLLKRFLGVKRTTPNWSVCLASKPCMDTDSRLFLKNAGPEERLAACTGLDRCNTCTHCGGGESRLFGANSGQPKVMREFVVDLRKRLRGVWNAEALAKHGEHTNKLAKYHHWMALLLRPCSWRALFCP